MEKQKKSVGTTLLVVLLLIVTIAALVLATYAWAKYTSRVEGNATAQVAKWNVTANAGNLTFRKTFTHVIEPNKLAPGTDGSFVAGLDVTGTEVDVNYSIKIVSVTGKPTHLALKDGSTALVEGSEITGTINMSDTQKSVSKTITWDWPYDMASNTNGTKFLLANGTTKNDITEAEYDAIDTTEGTAATPMVITYEVVATQVPPQ